MVLCNLSIGHFGLVKRVVFIRKMMIFFVYIFLLSNSFYRGKHILCWDNIRNGDNFCSWQSPDHIFCWAVASSPIIDFDGPILGFVQISFNDDCLSQSNSFYMGNQILPLNSKNNRDYLCWEQPSNHAFCWTIAPPPIFDFCTFIHLYSFSALCNIVVGNQ